MRHHHYNIRNCCYCSQCYAGDVVFFFSVDMAKNSLHHCKATVEHGTLGGCLAMVRRVFLQQHCHLYSLPKTWLLKHIKNRIMRCVHTHATLTRTMHSVHMVQDLCRIQNARFHMDAVACFEQPTHVARLIIKLWTKFGVARANCRLGTSTPALIIICEVPRSCSAYHTEAYQE